MLKALIFDFDGLIMDSEGPIYRAWVDIYARYGQELPLEKWAVVIGTSDDGFDPLSELETLLGYSLLERKELQTQVERRILESIAHQGAMPGVENLIHQARSMGLKLGLASSSDRAWVTGHLRRMGLLEHFDCIFTTSDVGVAKPDPSSYRAVLAQLGILPREAVALEDSPNGIRAAKQAGIFCIAVPNPLTARLDVSEADLRLNSLVELNLLELQKKFNGTNPAPAEHNQIEKR